VGSRILALALTLALTLTQNLTLTLTPTRTAGRGTRPAWAAPWCAATWATTSSAGSCGTAAAAPVRPTWTPSCPPRAPSVRRRAFVRHHAVDASHCGVAADGRVATEQGRAPMLSDCIHDDGSDPRLRWRREGGMRGRTADGCWQPPRPEILCALYVVFALHRSHAVSLPQFESSRQPG